MSQLYLDLAPPLAELIINRPDKRNALSNDMWAAIPSLIAQAESDPSINVILIHGGITGLFSAGADIGDFGTLYTTRQGASAAMEKLVDATAAIAACKKPVIAAIEGPCMGAGLNIAMAADLRIAGDGASFALPPANLGLTLPRDDLRRIIEAIGKSTAKDLLFTARVFGTPEAEDMGLLNRAVPRGEALDSARALAHHISKLSQWSHQTAKRMIANIDSNDPIHATEGDTLFVDGFENDDFREGFAAFMDKRKPDFGMS